MKDSMKKHEPRHLTYRQINMIKRGTDGCVYDWVQKSNFPAYSERWFLAARDEAFKSNFYTAKIGCVIVYKNHIIGRGHNQRKTDPYQKKYNQMYREWTNSPEFSNTCGHTLHAEIDALKNVPYPIGCQVNWKKVEVYIYRVGPGLDGFSGLAMPCEACAHALSDMGITKAYYTTGHEDRPFGCCDL